MVAPPFGRPPGVLRLLDLLDIERRADNAQSVIHKKMKRNRGTLPPPTCSFYTTLFSHTRDTNRTENELTSETRLILTERSPQLTSSLAVSSIRTLRSEQRATSSFSSSRAASCFPSVWVRLQQTHTQTPTRSRTERKQRTREKDTPATVRPSDRPSPRPSSSYLTA